MQEIDLSREIAAFLKEKPRLLRDYGAQYWAVFVGAEFEGAFETFQDAAKFAIAAYPHTQFLIRNIADEEPQFPFMLPSGAL